MQFSRFSGNPGESGKLGLWAQLIFPPADEDFVPSSTQILAPPKSQWLRELLNTRETRLSRAFFCIFLWSVCFYLVITHFIGGTIQVQGDSMLPTLRDGETYLVNRWARWFHAPKRTQLVVLNDPGYDDWAIKRVIGLGAECVDIRAGLVYIDNALLKEPYLPPGVGTFPSKGLQSSNSVPTNHIFVLGDNRPASIDSRSYGPIGQSKIVGIVASALDD